MLLAGQALIHLSRGRQAMEWAISSTSDTRTGSWVFSEQAVSNNCYALLKELVHQACIVPELLAKEAGSIGDEDKFSEAQRRRCMELGLVAGMSKSWRERLWSNHRVKMLERHATGVKEHAANDAVKSSSRHITPFGVEGCRRSFHVGAKYSSRKRAEAIVQPNAGLEHRSRYHNKSRIAEKQKQDIKLICNILRGKSKWGASTAKRLKASNVEVKPYHVCEVLRLHPVPVDRAFKFFNWARQQRRCKKGKFIYTKMIKILGDAGKFDMIWPLLDDMRKERREIDPSLFLGIIRSYVQLKKIDEAIVAFNAMEKYGCKPTTLSFNCMIDMLITAGDHECAESLFKKMDYRMCTPDIVTYSMLIDSRGKMGQLNAACQLFYEMQKRGCRPNVVTYSSLISNLGKAGKLKEACDLFQDMRTHGCIPNNVTYNGLISSLGQAGLAMLAYEYYQEMLTLDFVPDLFTYAVVIVSLIKLGRIDEVRSLCKIAMAKSRFSDFDILKSVLGSLCKSGEWKAALQFFEEVVRGGHSLTAGAYNVMIHSLSRAGNMEKAFELFEEMIHNKVASPDLVACNAVINGLVKEGNLDTACKVVDAMTEQGITPDSFTFINYINLLCKADRFDDAYQIVQQEVVKKGCPPNTQMYNVLIDNLGKAGKVEEALKAFDRMREQGFSPDTVTFNIVISILGGIGKVDAAYQLFQEMKEKACQPTLFSYNIMIGNLVRAGRANAGTKLFQEMLENQVSPNDITLKLLLQAHEETVEGYGELVDMCGEMLPLDCPPSST